MKLTAAEDCHEAQLTISCKEGGEILLGFISLMPDNTYMGHGLRTDLVEKLKLSLIHIFLYGLNQ